MNILSTLSKYFWLVLLFCLFQRCNIIPYHQQVPTYIHIDTFAFKNNPSVTVYNINGVKIYYNVTTSANITSFWAYYNNNPIGVFDLPATFPIITSGDSGTLQLEPGIAMDGLNDFVVQYPFYAFDTFSFKTSPGKVIDHAPVSQFFSGVNVTLIDDFENGLLNFGGWDNVTGGNLTITHTNPFQGAGAGLIQLDSASNILYSIDTSLPFNIPYDSSSTNPAYIEINYKNSIPFGIGIKANLNLSTSGNAFDTTTLINVYPSATWKKIYVQVNDFANTYKASNYNLYIYAGLPQGNASGTVYLDNIQLVTY